MLFRRKKYDQEPMPPWMKWVVVGFLGLAFLGNMHNKNNAGAPATIDATIHKAAENLNPKKFLPIDTYKSAFVAPAVDVQPKAKDIELLQNIQDITPGEGTPAICGLQVKVTYKTFAKEGDKPMDTEQTLTLRIGEGKAIPAIEQGIVGMKKGGKRNILATNKRFETELLDASPAIPDPDATPYRIATTAENDGPPIRCSQQGKFKMTIWSVDGKKLFSATDNQPLLFTPGKSEVFLGLEQGVIGMKIGEIRLLVVPPSFQKTMNGNSSAVDFHLPKDQTVLVDVEAMP